MSRFATDGLAELLSRTFSIADFAAGIYVETIAPDIRPAAFLVAMVLMASWWSIRQLRNHSGRPPAKNPTTQTLLGASSQRLVLSMQCAWLLTWFAWLPYSGNGRYILPLLLILGPLLGATIWILPISQNKRWSGLLIIAAWQILQLHSVSPAKSWSVLNRPWTTAHPLSTDKEFLSELNPDLVIITQAQSMTAFLIKAPEADRMKILSLHYAGATENETPEKSVAIRAIGNAQRPILLESYRLDQVPPEDVPKFTWRTRSVELLGAYGLMVDADTCRKSITSLNVLQIACRLRRTEIKGSFVRKAHDKAENAMSQLVTHCEKALRPFGERQVLADGSLIQVFREGRYVIRADNRGNIDIQPRGAVNFKRFLNAEVENITNIACEKLSV